MANAAGPIQCHYDVLGCEQDADSSVIKKKHRKLVLKYHPDKNLGDETAADQFMLVQRAYEVLSGKILKFLWNTWIETVRVSWPSNSFDF